MSNMKQNDLNNIPSNIMSYAGDCRNVSLKFFNVNKMIVCFYFESLYILQYFSVKLLEMLRFSLYKETCPLTI